MVAHLVLFTPRSDLSDAERMTFVDTFEHALANIPSIKRARIGRRLMVGRLYDQQNPYQFPYAAILEFESEADLRAYLEHPAHHALGEQFYIASENALAFDFNMGEGNRAREILLA
jgi:stress responsive alpha/beta barrel protein